MNPPKRLIDPSFRYVPSVATDIAKTFARIRKEQKAAAQKQTAERVAANARAHPLRKIG